MTSRWIRSSTRRAAVQARPAHGFSLIEMAVVLFVITLLIGSLLVPLSTQVEQRQVSETEKALAEIREALLGFAVANGYLPCPDTGTNGLENVAGNVCSAVGAVACGRLPHATLGVANSDVWGNRFTYCVNELFARRGGTPSQNFSLTTGGTDVNICANQACGAPISTSAVLAVVSHGRNGFGATQSAPPQNQNPAAPQVDEQENYDNNDRFIVWRTRAAAGAAGGEFDDIVVWLPRFTLFNRMVAAGRLP
jgi:prepilin-type N-terminal cleavage/methylation domain-containing protein